MKKPPVNTKRVSYMDPNYQEKFNNYLDNAPLSKYSDLNKVKDWDSNLYQNDRNANIINDLQVHDPSFNYYAAWKDNGEPSLNRFNTERSYYDQINNSINMSSDSPNMFQEEIGHALQKKLYDDGYVMGDPSPHVIYNKPLPVTSYGSGKDYALEYQQALTNPKGLLEADYNNSLRDPDSYVNTVNNQANYYPDRYFTSATTGSYYRPRPYNMDRFIEYANGEQSKLRSIVNMKENQFVPENYMFNKVHNIFQPMSYYTYGNVENENHNYIQPAIIEPKYNIDNQKTNAWDSTIKTLMSLKQQ